MQLGLLWQGYLSGTSEPESVTVGEALASVQTYGITWRGQLHRVPLSIKPFSEMKATHTAKGHGNRREVPKCGIQCRGFRQFQDTGGS